MLSDHSQMLHTTHVLRRPAVVIWGLAMLATGLAVVLLGAPRVGYTNLINAGMIIVLLIAGNRTAVELEDGSTLTPAPALLIAGLTIVGWPLLPISATISQRIAASVRLPAPSSLFSYTTRCPDRWSGWSWQSAWIVP